MKSLGPQDSVLASKELLENQEMLQNLSSSINSPVELKDSKLMSSPPTSEFDTLQHEGTPNLHGEGTEEYEIKRKDDIV